MKSIKGFLTVLLSVILITMTVFVSVSSVSALSATVYLSSYSGPPGTTVYVSAGNCTASIAYTITFGSAVVAAGTTSTSGTVNTYFTVPVTTRGVYSVYITTASDTTPAPPAFTVTPQVAISTASGISGDQVTVSGDGFYPTTTITIYFDNTALTPVSAVTSDAYGRFYDAVITIPQSYGGNHTVTASDFGGMSAGATFKIIPKMTLSTGTGAVGSSVTISGTGFAPSSTLSFSIDETVISTSASTNSSGNFSNVAITIPAISGGSHTLLVKDGSGNSLTVDFTVTAAMTVSATNGSVDTNVAIIGKGFLPSSSITVLYDGSSITTTSGLLASDANGSFNTSIQIPASTTGEHLINLTDGTNSISSKFTVSPAATINATSGSVGTAVTITGNGFKGNTKVSVTYNNVQIGTVTTSIKGSFTTNITIPSASTGAHSLVISDATNTQTFSFSIVPTATISSTSGYVGSEVTVNGKGFGSSKSISVKYDSTQVVTSTTDADGAFAASFKAPVSLGGDHVISVSDGTNTKTFKFAMDSTAPASPVLSLPADLTKLDKTATFAWTEVKDPSNVTYNLQISKDAAFSNLVLQKQGLTNPSYTLTTEEKKLKSASKDAPYYWRVKAVDGASNESAWSKSSAFLVGLNLGEWAIYIILGFVAILLGVGGFLLGRLMKPRQKAQQE